jgi:hypothetical protein
MKLIASKTNMMNANITNMKVIILALSSNLIAHNKLVNGCAFSVLAHWLTNIISYFYHKTQYNSHNMRYYFHNKKQ